MTLLFRAVQASDLPSICAFAQSEEELFFFFPRAAFPLTVAQLQAAIEQRRHAMVLEDAGRVVAFANFYRWEAQGSCSIGNLVVAPEARCQGVGGHMVEQMVALAWREYRACEVQIACFNRNVAGCLLYSRMGFLPFSIEERCDGKGERVALIHMKRRITAPSDEH